MNPDPQCSTFTVRICASPSWGQLLPLPPAPLHLFPRCLSFSAAHCLHLCSTNPQNTITLLDLKPSFLSICSFLVFFLDSAEGTGTNCDFMAENIWLWLSDSRLLHGTMQSIYFHRRRVESDLEAVQPTDSTCCQNAAFTDGRRLSFENLRAPSSLSQADYRNIKFYFNYVFYPQQRQPPPSLSRLSSAMLAVLFPIMHPGDSSIWAWKCPRQLPAACRLPQHIL